MDLVAKTAVDRRVAQAIEPTLTELGFELVRVRVWSSHHTKIQIMAQRPDGSMDVDDCGTVSRAVVSVLDTQDPVGGEWELEVSSPGIDRPLTRTKDFDTYAGREVRIETGEPIDARKRFRGELVGLRRTDTESTPWVVLVDHELGEVTVPLAAVTAARLTLDDQLLRDSLAQEKHRRENR